MKKSTAIVILVLTVCVCAHSAGAGSLYDIVAQKLISRYSLDTSTYKVEVLKGQIPDSEVDPSTCVVQPLFQNDPLGLVSVLVTLRRSDQSDQRGQFNLRVRKFVQVAVMREPLKLHDELSQDKLEMKLMDVTSLREQPLTSFGAIHGSRTKRNLAAGQILTAEAIETAPDIEVGREVTITFVGSAFTISTRGQAMQTGRRGELIRVRNAASGKTVLAKVSGEGEVRVEL